VTKLFLGKTPMLRRTSTTTASIQTLSTIRPAIIRAGLWLALLTALTAFAVRAGAQVTPGSSAIALLPPGVAHAPSVIAAPLASTSREVMSSEWGSSPTVPGFSFRVWR